MILELVEYTLERRAPPAADEVRDNPDGKAQHRGIKRGGDRDGQRSKVTLAHGGDPRAQGDERAHQTERGTDAHHQVRARDAFPRDGLHVRSTQALQAFQASEALTQCDPDVQDSQHRQGEQSDDHRCEELIDDQMK